MRLSSMLRGLPRRAGVAAAGGLVAGLVGGMAFGTRSSEDAWRRDEECLRLLATAGDVVFRYLTAPHDRFEYVSPSVEAVSGYTVEEHYADPGLALRMIHPDDRHVLASAVRSEEPSVNLELRWARKTGETLWIESRVDLIRDQGGRLLAVEGIARDVTARKETEEALRRSEEESRALFETMTQGVIYYDAQGYITAANPAATGIFGLTLEEMRSLSPLSASWRAIREDGSDFPNEERPVVVALRTRKEVSGVVMGIRPPVGETRWISFNAVPQFRAGEDRPYRVHVTLEDITERTIAQNELREAEERFRVAFSQAPIGVALVDLDGRYVQVNRALCEILGYGEEELLGKTFLEVTHPEDRDMNLKLDRRLLAGECEAYYLEKRYLCADDRTVWASVNVSLVRNSFGEALYYVGNIQDVSERKESERALRESEERYRLVNKATSEAIWDTDLVNETLRWGGAAESMFGYSADEPKDRAWWEARIHPEDRERVLASVRTVLGSDAETWSHEYRFRRADGSYSIVLNRGCVVRDEAGKPVRMIGSMRDVTKRRRAEAALKTSEERFRSLIQNSSDIITVIDADGSIVYHSPSMERVLGQAPADRVGKNVFESALIHPEDLPRHTDAIKETLRSPDATRTVEMRMRHRDGSWRHMEATMRNLVGEPSVGGLVANSRDITERRWAEEALKESEERFRLLAETTNDLVCLHDLDGRYLYVSPSSRRLLGYEPEELLGANPYDLMHPEDAPRVRLGPHEELLRGKLRVSTTCRYRTKSGDYAWFETVTGLIRDEHGRVVRLQTSSRDVGERKEAEEALEAAARAKTEFLADVSHELRTPLTVIRGNAEVGLQLQRDCVHGDLLEEIVRESGRVSRMVEDLLFLARSDSSETPPAAPFVPKPVSVAPFLTGLEARAELLAREHGAVLETTRDEAAAGTLRVDHIRVEQAVLALVDNAAKYGPEGGRISLDSTLAGDRHALRIEVADEGPGIPEEDLPRIFERFYRAGKSRDLGADGGGGTGLGLSIAKTIIEAQGGRIEARSRPGEGTLMTIHLPLSEGDAS